MSERRPSQPAWRRALIAAPQPDQSQTVFLILARHRRPPPCRRITCLVRAFFISQGLATVNSSALANTQCDVGNTCYEYPTAYR